MNSPNFKHKEENIAKFIHASDIHLGSQQFHNTDRSNDFIDAFKEILFLAKYYEVDFIILGGDIFNSLDLLPAKFYRVVKLLKKFHTSTINTIPIISIEGNHDIRKFSRATRVKKGQSWLKVLNELELLILLDAELKNGNTPVFKEFDHKKRKGGKITLKNATIYGNHYLGQTPIRDLRKIYDAIEDSDENFKILLQHFGIAGQMENVPGVPYRDLSFLKDKINYLALGHFHKQFIINNWIFNPGSSEAACSSDHFYERGIFLIQVLKKMGYNIKAKSIKLKNREFIWKTIRLNTHFNTYESLSKYIINYLSTLKVPHNFKRPPILYLRLTGTKPLNLSRKHMTKLSHLLIHELGVVDAKIYQKYDENIKTIDSYLCIGN
ncbi:MAG: hypothetical protein BAJALOKI1v1_180022 [Promethearchaeota archaeon]|nr:MAG: hypothetical protein BAJALOKI1v1_180022 [Candidatus Lokiarchaeota archaeon]